MAGDGVEGELLIADLQAEVQTPMRWVSRQDLFCSCCVDRWPTNGGEIQSGLWLLVVLSLCYQ